MQYLLLIYENENAIPPDDSEEIKPIIEEYYALTNEVREKGILIGAEPLEPTSTATTVRVREGKVHITDGPFAETKEQLGGFYLLECKDLDEAIGYASRIPAARVGSIEVRPIMKLPTS